MKKNSMAIIAIALAIIALLTGTAAAEILAESPHPYPDEYDNAWVITDPGATQMRLHFQRYHLETLGDMIRLYDGGNRLLKTYSGDGINYENVWTDWYPTNFIRVRFTSDSVGDAWGFLIDQRESNAAPTAPASIIYLHNITFQQTSITWIWTDPVSANFDHVMVYLDGVFQTNVTKGIQTFTVQGLSPSTSHTIATKTAGTTGLINQSWVLHQNLPSRLLRRVSRTSITSPSSRPASPGFGLIPYQPISTTLWFTSMAFSRPTLPKGSKPFLSRD